jgi:cytochrome c-type biogenesis protein CcmH
VVDYHRRPLWRGRAVQAAAEGVNLVLWLAGPALLLAGIAVAVGAQRRRMVPETPLSADEEARLQEILKK